MTSTGKRPPLNLNYLQNTTYQPCGPRDDYLPTFSVERVEAEDWRKTDYPKGACIVTTLPQEPGREEIARDGETQCMCTGWFKRMVLSTPGFPSPIVHPKKVVYEIREVTGRGLGVFATRDIEAGDLILAERPLIIKDVANNARVGPDLSQEEIVRASLANLEKSVEYLCSRMSPQTRKAFISLANSHKTDGSGPLTGIFRTNGFGVGVNDPEMPGGDQGKGLYSCVGDHASRFNHSCSPNASHSFNMPCFSQEIHAVRPIAKGEEITVTYVVLTAPAAERQIALKPYGFTCTCPACKNPSVSDQQRADAIFGLLPKTSQGVEHAEAALTAYEATGLQTASRYTELLRRVAQINRKKGNKERADALESFAEKIRIAQDGRASEPVKESDKPTFHMFGSPEDLVKFMMQHTKTDTERASMMNAFMQTVNQDPSNSKKIMGPDGKMITVRMSDLVPRPSGL